MKYPTKKQKQLRAARFLKAIEVTRVRTLGNFHNNDTWTQEEVNKLTKAGYVVEVTDAWGEMGSRGYSVVWFTNPENTVKTD